MKRYNQKYDYIDELKQAIEFLAWFSLMINAFMGFFIFVKLFLQFIGVL